MAQLADDFIDQVRRVADIVAVVSDYVTLKRSGTNFQALCPFHAEKTPSFSVSPQHQIYKCFGCGKAGNVFKFVMEITGFSFPQAVTHLAEKYGIPIRTTGGDWGTERKQHDFLNLMKWGVQFFQKELADGQGREARRYLEERKISPEIIEKFQLGFAPPGNSCLFTAARREGFEQSLLEQSGLIRKSHREQNGYYDLFRNRVIFPIWNVEGDVIAFGGRVLSPAVQPKYLNSPETPVFAKRKTLYAINHARNHIKGSGSLIVMEGYTDVLMAHQHDFPQAVATLGTSLTQEHTRIIQRYTDSVKLVFDGDAAGQNAMSRVLTCFLIQGLQLRIAVLPEQLDPCDLLILKGRESFREVIDRAEDIFDFQVRQFSQRLDLQSTGGRRLAIAEFKKTIMQIPDPVTQRLFIRKLGEVFKIPPDILVSEVKSNIRQPVTTNQLEGCRKNLQKIDEEFLLWLALHFPEKRAGIFADCKPEDFEMPGYRDLAQTILDHKEMPVDIVRLSTQLENDKAEQLVGIYYGSGSEIPSAEEIEIRLHFTLKAVTRKKHRVRLGKLKEILNSTSEKDQELRTQILEDVQRICQKRVQEIF